MKYRRLAGRVDISEVSFGCGDTARLMIEGTAEERLATVSAALDTGVNYFDTSPRYGRGRSERNLGETLEELGAQAAGALVGTKVSLAADELADLRGAVMRSVEGSLQRLRRSDVALLQLHNGVSKARTTTGPFPSLSPEDVFGQSGVLRAFEELRSSGVAEFLGFTAQGDTDVVEELIESGLFDTMQVVFNVFNPSAALAVRPAPIAGADFRGIIGKASKRGMGVLAIRVLGAGALAGQGERLPGDPGGPLGMKREDYVAAIEKAAVLREDDGPGHEAVDVALRFALHDLRVSTAVVGFSEPAHVRRAAEVCDAPPMSHEDAVAVVGRWQASVDSQRGG